MKTYQQTFKLEIDFKKWKAIGEFLFTKMPFEALAINVFEWACACSFDREEELVARIHQDEIIEDFVRFLKENSDS